MKKGFTLTELLIVVAILLMMAVILIGILNPVILVGKAHDAKRKSDLNKIKTALEDYYNDHGSYPTNNEISSWNQKDNCGKSIEEMSKYLRSWLCDPLGDPYFMMSDEDWFRVAANLENKSDKDIPPGWYEENNYYNLVGFSADEDNYGVSSSNVNWYDTLVDSRCNMTRCLRKNLNEGTCDIVPSCTTGGIYECFFESGLFCSGGINVCKVYKCPAD